MGNALPLSTSNLAKPAHREGRGSVKRAACSMAAMPVGVDLPQSAGGADGRYLGKRSASQRSDNSRSDASAPEANRGVRVQARGGNCNVPARVITRGAPRDQGERDNCTVHAIMDAAAVTAAEQLLCEYNIMLNYELAVGTRSACA